MPLAAVLTIVVLTGHPLSLNFNIYCCTALSKVVPRSSGLPHFLGGNSSITIPSSVLSLLDLSFIYAFLIPCTVLSLIFMQNVLKNRLAAAVTPIWQESFPSSARYFVVNTLYFLIPVDFFEHVAFSTSLATSLFALVIASAGTERDNDPLGLGSVVFLNQELT